MINYADVGLTIFLLIVAVLGFIYELAGETVPGWHTISYSAHRNWIVRLSILSSVLGLFVLLLVHFQTHISR